ncbi:MAG: nucleotidyltransferase family protein [Methanolinea sp.]|jgi:hypothetical protein|nr:nucleotidyltransferase family protein [Methanolinea sp.]
MINRNEVLATLRLLAKDLNDRYHVEKIGVFGSVSRGEQKEGSDIDILVEFSRPVGFFTFLELEEFLSSSLGAKVDLVTPDALKPALSGRILSEVAYA